MTERRQSRRRFLVELGGGVASVVLVAGCSSSESVSNAPAGTDSATTTNAPTGTAGADSATTTPSAEADEPTSGLAWEQVSFGFVSAYLLQRGAEVTIVDTGTGTTDEFESGLSNLGVSWSNVVNVILTHSHGDHVGGLQGVIDNVPNVNAYAGTGDLEAIARGGFDADRLIGVTDGDEIFGLEVISTPGHTAGHIVVFDRPSGLLVAGDAVNTSGGAVTGPNPDFTPNMRSAEASVAKIVEGRSITTALVGHGSPVVDTAGDSLAELVTSLG